MALEGAQVGFGLERKSFLIFIVFSDYYGNASFLILSVWFVILPPPATKQKPQFLLLQDKKAPSCTSSSCLRPAVPAVAVQCTSSGSRLVDHTIIWLRQKSWLFGSGKNYDYLAQAKIMIIWLRHKLWLFGSGTNYENLTQAKIMKMWLWLQISKRKEFQGF